MIFPKNYEQKTGFDSVRRILKDNCLSTLGQRLVDKIQFSSDFELISSFLNQTEELRQIILNETYFPSNDYFDLSDELSRVRTEGTFIEQSALVDLRLSLYAITEILHFFGTKTDDQYPALKQLSANVFVEKSIIQQIEKIIDEKGEILNNASAALLKIRNEKISKQSSVDKKLRQSLASAKKEGWVNSDIEIAVRNGRLVIPVPAAYKRKIKGFVHDSSATGQTVFIEPAEIFEINNEIRELENAEKREIIKILTLFTDFLRPKLGDLAYAYRFLGLIDFIRAKAKFALEINAVKPIFENKPLIEWQNATHPLLFLSHRQQNKQVIPLSISINQQQRILIISGPNAGGKSVCLKTVGLLQYMLQCGLLIPVNENSETGIFDNIFIDIGDEQSLENDLSTYSSHLHSMKHLLEGADSRTMFLIDEFGSGTEPQLGGAIAESVLESLNKKKAYGVVTTHYANLKLLSGKANGIVNAAMLFDTRKMQPLYKLKIGMPGSSFAFEIARNIGFPENILKQASHKTGKTQLDFDQKLQELETEKEALQKQKNELNSADKFLTEIVAKYSKLYSDLEQKKREIISNAKQEAKQLVSDTNKLIEKAIKEIKESNADKQVVKEIRNEIKKFATEIAEPETGAKQIATEEPEAATKSIMLSQKAAEEKTPATETGETPDVILQKGDTVRLIEQNVVGEVVEIMNDEALVAFDSFRIKTPLSRLEKVDEKILGKGNKKVKRAYNSVINELSDKMASFRLSIDVRGKRAEEALQLVGHYIDEAILLNVKEVSILHGKGNGILRQIIRQYLAGIKEVKQFRDEKIENGGHGITVVAFR